MDVRVTLVKKGRCAMRFNSRTGDDVDLELSASGSLFDCVRISHPNSIHCVIEGGL